MIPNELLKINQPYFLKITTYSFVSISTYQKVYLQNKTEKYQ